METYHDKCRNNDKILTSYIRVGPDSTVSELDWSPMFMCALKLFVLAMDLQIHSKQGHDVRIECEHSSSVVVSGPDKDIKGWIQNLKVQLIIIRN